MQPFRNGKSIARSDQDGVRSFYFFRNFFQITRTGYSFCSLLISKFFCSSVLLHCFFQAAQAFPSAPLPVQECLGILTAHLCNPAGGYISVSPFFQLISQHPLRLLQYPPQSSSPCPQSAGAGNHIYYSQQYIAHETGKVSGSRKVPE